MKRALIVIDMQNDFVSGALGTPEAMAILPRVCKKVESFDGDLFATMDTHHEDYLTTSEGKHLPIPHCIKHTKGWEYPETLDRILKAKGCTFIEKNTFGSTDLPHFLENRGYADEDSHICMIGICTDICVVSNAMIIKAAFPKAEITVDAACCAGTTPQNHMSALDVMACCQIEIVNRP